jgi:hypothetical protein
MSTKEPTMCNDDLPTTYEDDVEAHLLKEALATGAAAAAVLAGAASGSTMPARGPTSVTPAVAVLPDPGAMPPPKAPPIRTEASVFTKTHKHSKHHKK